MAELLKSREEFMRFKIETTRDFFEPEEKTKLEALGFKFVLCVTHPQAGNYYKLDPNGGLVPKLHTGGEDYQSEPYSTPEIEFSTFEDLMEFVQTHNCVAFCSWKQGILVIADGFE